MCGALAQFGRAPVRVTETRCKDAAKGTCAPVARQIPGSSDRLLMCDQAVRSVSTGFQRDVYLRATDASKVDFHNRARA